MKALEALQDAVDRGSVVVPLTPTTYHEVQGIRDYAIRAETARLASRLSGWHTFEPPTAVLEREIDNALHTLFATPADPPSPKSTIGWGAHYMFTGVCHRLHLVGDQNEITQLLKSQGQTEETLLSKLDELGQLHVFRGPGPGEDKAARGVHGYAPEKSWAITTERAERFKRMAASLAANPDVASRPTDLVNAAEYAVEIGEAITRRMYLAGLDIRTLAKDGGRDGMNQILDLLPSSVARRAILTRVLRDKNRPPTANDVNDADLYATLVPQSDLVIAEKAAHRALTGSKIIAGYSVQIEKSLAALPQAVAALIDDTPEER